MKESYYKVTLLSDVVLNSTLATECNMTSLDYIPGSNFLGMVASKLYTSLTAEEAYSVFHSGAVRFGDALISTNEELSYAMPSMLFMDKLNRKIGEDDVYLHHLIDYSNPPSKEGSRLQLKQERGGYLFANGDVLKNIDKSFSLKSAQDRKTRSSKDGAMFGFESMNKGLTFLFTVQFDDETHYSKINTALLGHRRLGKSKNAEFGQVKIELVAKQPKSIGNFEAVDYVLVYAQSNLCFLEDEFGLATFQPTAEQLGLEAGAKIDWTKSQIRTHSYSVWNYHRNTTNCQRDCISKGSVFYVTGAKLPTENTKVVGLHQAEGFGRLIYNPLFLDGNVHDALCKFTFRTKENEDKLNLQNPTSIQTTKLSKFLSKQSKTKQIEKNISETIQELVYSDKMEIKNLKKISPSQWGGIRAYATKAKDFDTLYMQLFEKDNGYLTHGVADEKYWGNNRGVNRKAFEEICNENKLLGTEFIAKFAAEMAKKSRKNDKSNNTK